MERHRQTVEDILARISVVPSSWRDDHADLVVAAVRGIPEKESYRTSDVRSVLEGDFEAGMTVLRLILEMSKDEFQLSLRAQLGQGGAGIARFHRDPETFVAALEALGLIQAMGHAVNKPVSWRDVLIERLKGGRGSAIKGQLRGRWLEDFTEDIVRRVYGDVSYDVRCQFVGAAGTSTEKTDFAIPSKDDPRILIEVKAYGATGSKQSDIIGDVGRIVEQKRHDTNFLLVTDGITWQARVNDLRKLVALQNRGLIARIYTQQMADELEQDLRQLRSDHAL